MSMKILTMCQGGNSRSVAAGYLLKYKYNVDAVACSWEKNSKETLQMLFEWADHIVIMQGIFIQHIPEEYRRKVIVVDVGPDVWFNGLHPALLEIVETHLDKILVPVPA